MGSLENGEALTLFHVCECVESRTNRGGLLQSIHSTHWMVKSLRFKKKPSYWMSVWPCQELFRGKPAQVISAFAFDGHRGFGNGACRKHELEASLICSSDQENMFFIFKHWSGMVLFLETIEPIERTTMLPSVPSIGLPCFKSSHQPHSVSPRLPQ